MSSVLQEGTEGASIVEDEERLHGRVQTRIASGVSDDLGHATAADIDYELLQLRDLIAEAKPEDLPPLVEQMTRFAAIRARLGGSKSLPIDPKSPYFAHMVLREGDKTRDVLIGKRGFIDRAAGVQIVDWRNAPISQVYYRYDEGDDYDEMVGGRKFEGIIDVRRNVSIVDARLRRIGTPDGTYVRDREGNWHEAVGDMQPTLQGGVGKAARVPKPPPEKRGDHGKGRRSSRRRSLGVHSTGIERADKHLPEIAALIDAEQFDLISQPSSGMVVIQGGAGSGKTTVALHRVAFLCFADRGRFRAHRMLFVVPTESLVRYVAGVLPSLGVRGVPVVTYAGWARKQRQRLLPGSPKKYTDDAPDSVSQLKKHPALLRILDDHVAEQTASVGREVASLGALALTDRWRRTADEPIVARLRKLLAWAKAADALSAEQRTRAHSTLLRLLRRVDDIMTDWGELLTDKARLTAGFSAHAAEPPRPSQIEQLVSWCTAQQLEATSYTDDEGRAIESVDGHSLDGETTAGRLDVEDDPILLRMIQLKRGGLLGRNIKEVWYQHVAIDEAQDRSAIEVQVLLEATAAEDDDPTRRSVTIAGDTAQRLIFDNHFEDWAELLKHVGYSDSDAAALVKPLTLSYRSTAEVMQLARVILGPDLAPDSDLMARSGAPVELHGFGDVGEAVSFLAESLRDLVGREPSASCAVIARYPEQADVYFEGLKRSEVPALRRIRNHEFAFAPGVDVTDVSQVKGLEFDYVVMVEVTEASYPTSVDARHLLHIGATRAAHQLWLVSSGSPLKLLPAELAEAGLYSL